ncbi:hypothetical protein QN277_027233 [Acacia crassicarpa]|uniref:Uncharacterized protein n=1 Tax=Acacia crassicarpa TaxID=499986 RepID=A0AAE1J9K1_9FABA|nr:hypothetical protein QN277_027233 [Acacia crassicarpa]
MVLGSKPSALVFYFIFFQSPNRLPALNVDSESLSPKRRLARLSVSPSPSSPKPRLSRSHPQTPNLSTLTINPQIPVAQTSQLSPTPIRSVLALSAPNFPSVVGVFRLCSGPSSAVQRGGNQPTERISASM